LAIPTPLDNEPTGLPGFFFSGFFPSDEVEVFFLEGRALEDFFEC